MLLYITSHMSYVYYILHYMYIHVCMCTFMDKPDVRYVMYVHFYIFIYSDEDDEPLSLVRSIMLYSPLPPPSWKKNNSPTVGRRLGNKIGVLFLYKFHCRIAFLYPVVFLSPLRPNLMSPDFSNNIKLVKIKKNIDQIGVTKTRLIRTMFLFCLVMESTPPRQRRESPNQRTISPT